MINVSNKFKQALLDDKRQFQIEATITLIDDTELTITNSELWSQGFEIDTSVSGNNSFDIGGLIIGRMTLVINNIYEDYTQYDFFDADVDVTLALLFDDGTSESIVFDNFIVDEATDNESQIVLTCLDNAKHFERPYSESNLVYPASVDTIVRDACDTCGVPLLTTSIRNGNYIVPTRPSSDGLTFLKVVSWCAQLTGNFARINNHGQLVVGWYDRNTYDSVNKTNGTEWTITGNTAKKFHHIVSWSSLTVGTDDVTVTGLRVVATSSDNTEFVGFYGNEGYVLEVRGNDLIGVSDVQNIANSIGANVVGLKLRTYNGACLGDPTIEASDLAWITDRKNRSYKTLICGTSFKLGQYQSLYCGASTPSKRASTSYSESTRAIVKTRQEIKKSLADYDSRVSSMAELIARGFGMYFTPVTQSDGSVIPYIHDEPTVEESSYIAYMTSQGIMMESDGSTTAAVDRNGNALLNTLTARGINADWINSGAISIRDTQGNETFYANCLTGVVRINATSFSLTGSTIQQITQQAVDNIEVGGRNLLLATGTAHASRSDDPQYTQEYQVTDYGETLFDNTETDFTISFDYELQGDYSSVSDSSQIYAVINGTDASPSNPIYVKGMPANGHYKTTCKLTQAQVASASKTCSARWSGIVSGCTFTVKNFKLETGSVETDWTPAPEDMQSGIDVANSTANSANSTAQQANSTARQALDIASSAGGLVAYLDNDYQSVPTDADGNYVTFPECSSKITVFYNSSDVSSQCTYTVVATNGVTGSWNGTARTYTVTGLSTDSGTVTITAAYDNTSLSKKFTVIKVRQGISGTNGHNGENGRGISSMEEYYAISESNTEAPETWSINVVAPTESSPYLWNFNRIVYDDNTQEDSQPRVIGNYARNGTDGQPGQNGQNGQNGRGITSITEHYGLSNSTTTEPTSWSDTMQVPTSSAKFLWNYETIAYTDGTSENTSKRIIGNFGADGKSAYNYELILSDVAIVKDGEGNITPQTITMTAKRGQGTSTPGNYAGRFRVEVTTNGTSYTTAYTSSANEATHTYTPTGNEKNIRVSLYLAGGTSTLLDSQNIPIVSDGADGFSPTVVSNKADGVTTVTITDASGTRSFTVNDGTDGASIATVTNYYLASASATGVTTSTSGWSTNPTSSSATITKDKPYLWNYEVSKDNNGKTITTTMPSVIGHFGSDGTNGTNGTNGKDGKGIASIEEYYAIFSSPTSAPSDSQFTKNVVAPTSTSRYLWNYEVVTYTDNSSEKTDKRVIGVYGDPGTSIKAIDNYYLASASATGVTTSTSGWTKDPTNANATISEEKPYLWSYEVTIDNNDQVITTTDPAVIGHYGQTGATGKGIKSISEYYALSNTTTAPDDSSFGLAVKTPSISNRYLWNYEKITYTDDSVTTTSKHIIGVYGDPATTIVLTNESHTFPGDVSNALASSFDCSVFAYSGTTRVPANIGNITGLPSKGLSVTITNNETTTAKITVSSTTDLTLQSGTLNIPITVEGKTFTKKLAWSVAYRGRTGEGTPARSYFLDLSSKSVKFGENLNYFPSILTAKAYYRDGASTSQTAYTGYIGVQVCIGNTWSTVKNFNASTVSLSLVSNSTATKATINDSNELTLPLNSTAIRFQLKATSSSTVYFDQQDTTILIDIESLTQEAIFNKLTNNSRDQGVYLENGKVYINAEYIQSWIMKLGGANNRNGFLDVYDANGNLVGYWTKDGIKLGGTLTDVHASTDAPNTLIDVNGKIETKRLVASENIKIDGVPQAGIIGSSYDGYFIFPFGWSLYKDDDNYGKFELTENGLDIDTGYGTHIKAGSSSCALSIEDDASEITTFIRNDEIVLNQDEDGDGVTYVGKETHINTDEIRILEGLTNPEQAVMTTDYIGIGGVTKATSDAYMAKNGHVFGSQFGVASATTDHIASYKFVNASNGEPAQYKLTDSAFKSFMKIRTVSDSVTVTKDSYADSTIYLYNASYNGWYPIAIAGFRVSGSSYLSVLQVYLSNGDLKYRLGCRGSSSNVSATFYADILYVRE